MNRWNEMAFKLASYLLIVYSLTGIAVITFSYFENTPPISLIFYITAFIVIPLYGAYGAWRQRRKALFISLLFFLSQTIRIIGGEHWFPSSPPISLGIPFGDFSNGQGYLIDFLAIAMAIYLACLLRMLITFKHSNE
jgi:hypothetical protein